MSVDLPRPPSRTASPVDPEVVSLVTGIIGNIETLVAQQMRLAQREVAAGIKSRSAAGAVVVSGLAVGMLATSAMSAAAAHGLHGWLSPGVTDPAAWSLGACYALVGAVLGLLGAGLVGLGLWKFRAIAPWSGLAENLIQESTSWTKAPQ